MADMTPEEIEKHKGFLPYLVPEFNKTYGQSLA